MLWNVVTVLFVILAFVVLVLFTPGAIGRRGRRRQLDRMRGRDQSKASPRRDSSSST